VYRLPYASGTSVFVSGDHFTHSPDLYEYDIYGTGRADGEYTVVAAAAGVIRQIIDSNAEPTDSNNQVWIEHANGEWTKYGHLKTNSVTDLGLEVGDLVSAGTVIGIEGDVGQAKREHVHFQVMVPDDPANSRDGQTRVPLICGIPGNIMYAGRTYTAGGC
jgi:murein DD-endopeptidase MepM/ murein hydrolase activator NlpD